MGTSVRGDLGIPKKSWKYPGPANYNTPIDDKINPTVRIGGTFGTA